MAGAKAKNLDLTEGVIWKQLLRFLLPIAVGTLFQQLYNTVDAVIVGQFVGSDALAAVGGSSAMIVQFLVGIFTGLSSGATVVISHGYGADDRLKLERAMHTRRWPSPSWRARSSRRSGCSPRRGRWR